jgi:hypothetical protein
MPFAYPVVSATRNTLGLGVAGRVEKVHGSAYLFISCRFATGSKAEQGLERGHGLPAAIVAKNKFIEINL